MREGLEPLTLPRTMLSELLLRPSVFLGFPAMLDGFETLLAAKPLWKPWMKTQLGSESARRGGLRTSPSNLRHADSAPASSLRYDAPRPVGEDRRRCLPPESFPDGLSLRERDIVNVVALALGGYQRQLYSHVRGAIRVGVPPETIGSVPLSVERLTGTNLGFAKDALRELTP